MKSVLVEEEIEIPNGVKVNIESMRVTVIGPKGTLIKDFSYLNNVRVEIKDNKVIITSYFADKRTKALTYMLAGKIRNMILGVTKGFRYYLKIVHSHFPISVKVQGKEVLIQNLIGEKNVRRAMIMGNTKVNVKGEDIIVEGIDIEDVGQTAANIENASKLRKLDRRVFMDGIYIYKREVIE
jgi:large subunit ribosomal protein L6